ncbi:hypothetical protein GNIT_3313 [Glaciecola nitratireducens FR1064]|uniref:Uncharacterized protein n=1 Tax=Glaciecola nitratireducens (strain JCM 12485 / KCTC 12276 / FR1064) TaxID=1085623 RepID=G4QMY8_GLANF|nr:hypothetical protein GNIT_3313 [Glaciecola nitratireducens FR1064]
MKNLAYRGWIGSSTNCLLYSLITTFSVVSKQFLLMNNCINIFFTCNKLLE